ncbi:hypothetical protein NDU88_002739 [Pleurodeles waltl]|uniref:L1 transposable element RRM domain-containing protein n=1 Tax=Pleurodeles waltl TaxID=8319 RepID=A0AAV7M542_PLEWA|nr:hypothetical protein NDU88_002739 [Pleurodeles waltl]
MDETHSVEQEAGSQLPGGDWTPRLEAFKRCGPCALPQPVRPEVAWDLGSLGGPPRWGWPGEAIGSLPQWPAVMAGGIRGRRTETLGTIQAMPRHRWGVSCSTDCKMGKADKLQTKLQFTEQKTPRSKDGCREEPGAVSENQESDAEPELHHILTAMQSSLATINCQIDSLSYMMDRMTEQLDKQVERVDEAECRISVVEDECNNVSQAQTQADRIVAALWVKVEDLEARSCISNMQVVGTAESPAIDNMETFMERLLGRETFSVIFVVDRTHHPLVPKPPPGAPPHLVITKLLNHRDCDEALRKALELKTLQYEGKAISLYPDFTQQVQKARRLCVPMKHCLQELNLEYPMLYPAKLRVTVDGKSVLFTDHKQLQQVPEQRDASGERRSTRAPTP